MIVVRLGAMLRKFFSCFSLSFVFLLLGCASLARPELSPEEEAALYPLTSYVPEFFEWKEVCPGVSRFDFESNAPNFPLIYHAVKIELTGQGTGGTNSVNTGMQGASVSTGFTLVSSQWEHTSAFAARESCLIAMNATPFDITKLAGLYKLGGELLSEPVARYAALGLRCGGGGEVLEAQVFESQMDGELSGWEAAFGGFFVVLEKGVVRTEYIRRTDSRSGAGISADGKTLYLLVVEGEHPRQSRGLSYPQCGEIFLAMGCSDALEFDGGGSSDLCIKGRSVMTYRVHRRQGNSIGFKVK